MSSQARSRPVTSESPSSQPRGVDVNDTDPRAPAVTLAKPAAGAPPRARGKRKRRGKSRRTGRSASTRKPRSAPQEPDPPPAVARADRNPVHTPDIRYCEISLADETFAIVSMPACDPTVAKPLTPGERDIVVRILLGQSNQEIADARGSQLSTVSNQVYSIFDKLGVESRTQLAERIVHRTANR